MSLYDLDSRADADRLDYMIRHPANGEPPWFRGMGLLAPITGIVSGIGQIGLFGVKTLGPAIRPIAEEIDKAYGVGAVDWWDNEVRAMRENALRAAELNPYVFGKAANILHGLVRFGTEAGAGFAAGGLPGAVALTAGAEGVTDYERMREAGVDEQTARTVAGVTAFASGAGVALPMLGKTAKETFLRGLVLTPEMNAFQRGVTGETLREAGYPEMAEQYRALDGTAVLTDIVLGAGFGLFAAGIHGLQKARVQQLLDAAQASAKARHLEASGPGIPADPATRNATVEATLAEISRLIQGAGRDPNRNLDPGRMHFIPDPVRAEAAKIVRDGMKESFPELFTGPRMLPEVAPAKAPEAPTTATTGLKEGLGAAGKAITDNLYQSLFDALKAGKTTMAGIKDPVLAKSRAAFDAGIIKNADDLKKYVADGYPPVKAPPPATPEEAAVPVKLRQPKEKTVKELGEEGRRKMLRALKKYGGINIDEAPDIVGEKGFRANSLYPGLFRRRTTSTSGLSQTGHGIDIIAEKLHDLGYISDAEYWPEGPDKPPDGVAEARDLIGRAIMGEAMFRIQDMDDVARTQLAEAMTNDLDLPGHLDALDAAEARAAIDEMPGEVAVAEAGLAFDIEAEFRKAGIAVDSAIAETIMERASIRADSGEDYGQAARSEMESAIRGRESGEPSADAGQGKPAAEGKAEAQEVGTTILDSYSNADLLAKEQAMLAAAKMDDAAVKAMTDKAIADQLVETFALTGSDRAADTPGQLDILQAYPGTPDAPIPREAVIEAAKARVKDAEANGEKAVRVAVDCFLREGE